MAARDVEFKRHLESRSFRRIVKNNSPEETDDEDAAKFIMDPVSIAWLENVVGKVAVKGEERGVVSCLGDLAWLRDPKWANSLQPRNEDILSLKLAADDARAAKQALRTLLQAADDREAYLRERLAVLSSQAYFSSLPDELVAYIFELAGNEDFKMACRISVVSKRFRRIALSLSSLWKRVDAAKHSLSDAKLRASRSTGSKIHLRVGGNRYHPITANLVGARDEDEQFLTIFKFAASISSRLSVLEFALCVEANSEVLEELASSHSALAFPSLHTLSIEYEDEALDDMFDFDVHFYRHWDLPSLRTLRAENVIPQFKAETTSNFHSCSLHLRQIGDFEGEGGAWSLSAVTIFLGTLKNLVELEITLCHYFRDIVAPPVVSLTTLRRLSYVFYELDLKVLRNFCKVFSAPNITHWSIDIDVKPDAALEEQLYFIVPTKMRLPNLTDLDIAIRRDFGRGDKEKITDSCSKFPTLENLSVGYPNGEQGFFDRADCKLQLRQIHLRNCKGMVNGILDELEDVFWQAPDRGTGCLVIDGSDSGDGTSFEKLRRLTKNAKVVRDN